MKHAQKVLLNSRNNVPDPPPFFQFLTGGAGVGKSFLINCIAEYLKHTLKYPGQDFSKQPSVKVTASTGKAATNINGGTTLHSAFHLPVHSKGTKSKTKPGKKILPLLQEQYKYLKVLIIDEISMTDKDTSDDLNVWLRLIMNRDDIDFGGVSILVVGDFFQLPPTNKKYIFRNLTLTDAWYRFEIYELTEIVRQSNDPEFARLLNRLREDNHTKDDLQKIHSLEGNDESNWPKDHIKVYITNHLKEKHNVVSTEKLLLEDADRVLYTFQAKDSHTDVRTGALALTIDPTLPITKTGGLPSKLQICVGNLVMLTYNKSITEKLINGSVGTVVYVQSSLQNRTASGVIYVKFEDETAGNSFKNQRLRGDLKHCVPISVISKRFLYERRRDIWVERKQFPLVLCHALTIHKSQGSTYEYMTGDMDRTTKSGKGIVPISSGMFYTLLSRAKSCDKVKIKNFKENVIKVADIVKEEMARLRKYRMFSWTHPVLNSVDSKVCLLNIVSWNKHISHFMSDVYYRSHCSIFCFTETHTNILNTVDITDYDEAWRSIHHPSAEHGLAFCYNTRNVTVIKQFPLTSAIQMLPVFFDVSGKKILFVLVYRPPLQRRDIFLYQLLHGLDQLRNMKEVFGHRMIVLGDFNTDQMLEENVNAYYRLCEEFNLFQRSQYSTHIYGGILDLVFDTSKFDPVQWMPSPYSDHFVLIVDL